MHLHHYAQLFMHYYVYTCALAPYVPAPLHPALFFLCPYVGV